MIAGFMRVLSSGHLAKRTPNRMLIRTLNEFIMISVQCSPVTSLQARCILERAHLHHRHPPWPVKYCAFRAGKGWKTRTRERERMLVTE